MIGRILAIALGLVALALGGLGIAALRAPTAAPVVSARSLIESAGAANLAQPLFSGGPLAWGVLGVGLLLIGAGCAPRGGGGASAAPVEADGRVGIDARLARKVEKQAAALARKGKLEEAAELCFHSGLLDAAAEYYEQGELFGRAADIHYSLERVEQAAELQLRAGQHEHAGRLFAELESYERAAECFRSAGRSSVAAEMFEKAGDPLRAAEAYSVSGFHRHAAQAFVHARDWARAARSLEEAYGEEAAGGEVAPGKQKELRRMVLQAGKLYERAGDLEASLRVLEKGGCNGAAGEVAQRLGQLARAAELYLAANDPPRAAEVLEALGEGQAAARVLGEYHRDRGEPAEAARCFLDAGEHLEAGDLFRRLEDMARAGACYEQAGDRVQAAEAFQLAGEWLRAAENFEAVQHFDEAASSFERAGEGERQAAMLELGGHRLRAGRLHHERGAEDDAIRVLQQVSADDADYGSASALLGEIFAARGQHGLAVAKLRQAIGDAELDRGSVDAWYRLARVYEEGAELDEAVAIFERILAFDYHYEDVADRIEAAKERLRISSQSPASSSPGQPNVSRPGRYRIEGELGRGGMGIVYKAQDTVLDRPVAFKVLPETLQENPQALKNFLREAKSAAKLNHPNIVTVYDAGEQDGAYYIAMEYVDGTTLKEIVRRRGAVPTNGVLQVLVQMCEALRYAHEQKVVHRDVKTANTMWTREKKAKIMDFGLARVMEEVRNHTTLVSGTPYYMSPEQTLGRNIDHRTDIYSLGVTVFELATGTLPFREGNVPYHHVHTAPPDARERKADVPDFLAEIIGRCLQKSPDARYPNAREILVEVKAALARSRG